MENQSTEINNLKKYGKIFQNSCIGVLISDRTFLERIIDILSPDYFETDSQKWVVSFIVGYFPKYKELPTASVFVVEINKISDVVLQEAIKEQIKLAYKQISSPDIVYVKEQFLEFCKNQKLKNAIYESAQLLNRGEYESIWKVINEASKAGMERNFGLDFCNGIDICLSSSARDIIKTNWDVIDVHLDGGLGKGELGFIVMPPGGGKTWSLIKLGKEAMKQGKNVMHFSMELGEKYVGRRYASCFTGITFQDVAKYPESVKDSIKNVSGKLFVKYFPPKTVSAMSLKLYLDKFTLTTGIKIDLLIVDYADLLKPFSVDKNSSLYTEGNSIYVELRSVAGELQIPTWSASQCNRSSAEDDIIVGQGVADSFAKIMIGDFIMSASRRIEDKLTNTARVHIIKSRFGSDGSTYPCKFNASNGDIEVYDKDSVEGMELINKAKSPEEGMKTIMRKRWKNIRGGDDNAN